MFMSLPYQNKLVLAKVFSSYFLWSDVDRRYSKMQESVSCRLQLRAANVGKYDAVNLRSNHGTSLQK